MLVGIVFSALIAWIVASAYAWSWVMRQAALSEAETWDLWKVKATVQKARLGGGSGLGQRPSVTNQTNNQTHSLHSKPRIMSGRIAD